jgi:3'-phosphoadenosine 5'-phosphosulfate sulfotransferase (PAPS reductase)/FAD synthetase
MTPLHVVALSGGKDSTAMALRPRELNPDIDYTYICTPTGNELPEMWAHWRKLGELLGKPIQPVIGGELFSLIRQQKMIPNWRARFCTRMLKIEPYAAWLMQMSKQFYPIISYVGIRADEPEREAGDYTNVPGVEMVFPLRDWEWGLAKVLDYLAEREVTIPIRSDCAVCFFQRLGEWYDLWLNHIEQWMEGEEIEEEMGHTFRSASRDTWPAAMKDMRVRFENGDRPRGMKESTIKPCRVCRT